MPFFVRILVENTTLNPILKFHIKQLSPQLTFRCGNRRQSASYVNTQFFVTWDVIIE